MWALDLALADVVATSSDPRLGAIRLAWWRERLEALDARGPPPAEPRLTAVAEHLVPRGVSGGELSRLEDAWAPMLDPFPWGQAQAEGFARRGALLFAIGARLLGAAKEEAGAAGECWSLHDGAVHCSDPASRAMLEAEARAAATRLPGKAERGLRPLTILAALGLAELDGRSRGLAAIRHRLTGRLR